MTLIMFFNAFCFLKIIILVIDAFDSSEFMVQTPFSYLGGTDCEASRLRLVLLRSWTVKYAISPITFFGFFFLHGSIPNSFAMALLRVSFPMCDFDLSGD
ncbi:hypothetical protein AFL22_11295 [Pantoea sp. CFSAN033090]|nr:hypothetical protein AFL22_11295 [Pantoea sp. CFSAN033090]